MAPAADGGTGHGSVGEVAQGFAAIMAEAGWVVVGKDQSVALALICLLAEGHLLIEDVPGVGKTLLAKTLAACLDGTWGRIQFTADLLPSDVTGVTTYNRATNGFEFHPGGIFANLVLGDEINRASPKTQSALLEAMEEGHVTVDGTTHHLPRPHMVIATQNPVEHEGTYPLPESQLDRFLMRISMGYPERGAEIAILDAHGGPHPVLDDLRPAATMAEVMGMIGVAGRVHTAPALKGYLVDLAAATRRHPDLALGASTRAALGLLRAARVRAAASGRDYVVPDDIKALAAPVLEHRLMLTPEAMRRRVSQGQVLASVLADLAVSPVRG
ncbi:MAG: AAA family ATPase [Acidimicrobiales bacterium]